MNVRVEEAKLRSFELAANLNPASKVAAIIKEAELIYEYIFSNNNK